MPYELTTSQFNSTQITVMVGETGTGKTTQQASSTTQWSVGLTLFQDTTICLLR